ncbi:23S rRNA (adenine(2030)-N(6))-methyltransferase RlmJ [Dechloromonas denitrificans]|uniref:23S rRNA (adenine(2030)-N(6))-methyltransferase RlmJ n=1 Tax=Dechloromonas denitrificans TaxID=281362 RepID=UPI001CF876F2|nr:23S rRNA (adenine(2030)-N(6))-methyltransferase RlmJ [Dechloromonas denitrificans]UCV05271.1 23S rRNA (adenine(2030)-N(6))-methyltransferase RlmJ [Dechloromonas denitrificans]
MLSYRHAFHAGNHADVLKHIILIQIAEYMGEKPAPFWIIDTHAGAGRYALESAHATKLAEYKDGVGRLWGQKGLPPAAVVYLEFVKMLNPDDQLRYYPGSPWLASQLMRESDRLRLYELHSTDVKLLQECFKSAGREVAITAGDGFAGLKAILPPPPRRALVLIDPSYETRDDYSNVVKGLQEALKRFPTGTYAVWYPMLSKLESRKLPAKLKGLGAENWLHVSLEVSAPSKDGYGMNGSGMFIINPPWTLEKKMHETLPKLTALLAQGEGAKYTVESESS